MNSEIGIQSSLMVRNGTTISERWNGKRKEVDRDVELGISCGRQRVNIRNYTMKGKASYVIITCAG